MNKISNKIKNINSPINEALLANINEYVRKQNKISQEMVKQLTPIIEQQIKPAIAAQFNYFLG